MNYNELIATFALAGSVVGVALVYAQIRVASNTAKASLLFSINRDLNEYANIAIKLDNSKSEDWVEKISQEEKEQLLDYITYFEGIELSLDRGLFKINEVGAFFANRFYRLSNNEGVRLAILLNHVTYGDAFRPIFSLHARLSDYRNRRGLPVPFGGLPLQ